MHALVYALCNTHDTVCGWLIALSAYHKMHSLKSTQRLLAAKSTQRVLTALTTCATSCMYCDNISLVCLLQEFVKGLLILEPTERMTAEQALEHPWLHMNDHPTQSLSPELFSSLNEYRQMGALKKAALVTMAYTLTQVESIYILHRDETADMRRRKGIGGIEVLLVFDGF